MKNLKVSLTGTVAALGLVITAAAILPACAQGQNATLTGTWKLNQERSAEERKAETGKDPELLRGRGKPAVGMDGRARGGGGGAPPEPAAGGGGRGGPGGLGAMSPYARSPRQLAIAQTDSTVTITTPDGRTEDLYLDGRKAKLEIPGAEPIETSARWKGGKLILERKFGSTGSVRETYFLGAEGKELEVDVRITGAELTQPMDMKRVYDLVPPGN